MWSCSEEKMLPELPEPPPPVEIIDSLVIEPSLNLYGYSNIKNRLGGGDYLCDTLFYLSNLPDGNWDYILELGESKQVGVVEVVDEKAKLPNKFKLEDWLLYVGEESVMIGISLSSDDFIMKAYADSFIFNNESYKIRTWQDLQAMQYDLDGNYELTKDIIFPEPATEGFPEQGFIPVGTSGPSSLFLLNAFKGSLNGYGYKIKNFTIDRADLNYVGLFGVVADATIKDIIIELAPRGVKGGSYVGTVAGYVARKSTIENCKVYGDVKGLEQVGGISGEVDIHGVISYSRLSGSVEGLNNVGGIVGVAKSGAVVSTNFVEGVISGTDYLGGIVGYSHSFLKNSQTGDDTNPIIIEGRNYVGGIVGYNNGEVAGSRVINGIIEGERYLGGIIGYSDSLAICSESCSKMRVEGETRIGGLIGNNKGKIYNSYSLGEVKGVTFVGGLVGEFRSEVYNSYSSVDISSSSTQSSGTFLGNNKGTITNCYFDSDKKIISKAVGEGSEFGLTSKSKTDFLNFSSIEIPRKIFVGWDFKTIWENEVPLKNNDKYPGLKSEFNFE